MTCFKNAEGVSIRSLCKNAAEYARFYRAVEDGMSTEEAFLQRTKCRGIGHPYAYDSEKIKKVIDNFDYKAYKIIINRCRRNSCSIEEGIKWAAQTGRVTVKRHYRKQYLKRS